MLILNAEPWCFLMDQAISRRIYHSELCVMYYLHWEPFRGCHASQWTNGEGATSQAITALKGSSPPAADPWRDAYVPGDAAPLQGRVHLDQFVVEPTALSKVVQRTGSVDSVGSIVLGDNLAVGAAAARRAWR